MQVKQLALAIASIGLASSVTMVHAEEAKQPAVEKIVVTGSNIKRVKAESASPITIITREDIERRGVTTIAEVLKEVSSNIGGVSENNVNTFTPGANGLNLRGLGGQATLVLLNGRRVLAYGQPAFQSQFADLNTLPMAAVERIEILKDGASAIYGSDAMAGVVNVILRKSYAGLEVDASYGASEVGDGDRTRASATFGFGDLAADRWNAFANVEFVKREPVLAGNRDYYIGTTDRRAWGYEDERHPFGFPGNYVFRNPAATNGLGFMLRPIGNCPEDRIATTGIYAGGCVWDDLKDGNFQLTSQSERTNVVARGTFNVTENLTLSAEGSFGRNVANTVSDFDFLPSTKTLANGTVVRNLRRMQPSHPQYPTNIPAGTTAVDIFYGFADLGGRGTETTADFTRGLLSAQGSFGNWDWDTGLLSMESDVKSRYTGRVLSTPWVAAFADGSYKFGGPNSAELLARLNGTVVNTFTTRQDSWDGKISNGNLFDLPGGSAGLAAGFEIRKEKLDTNPDPIALAGELLTSSTPAVAIHRDRDVKSIFAELSLPVLKSLEAQLAIRNDKYSDFGNATKPKLGLKWTPLSSLAVRATYAEGFRAPTLIENSNDVRDAFTTVRDPQRCLTVPTDCQAQVRIKSGSNPNLKPENSESTTFGFVFEPSASFNGSLDFYRIKRMDEITTLDTAFLLANESRYPGLVVRDPKLPSDPAATPVGPISLLNLQLLNVALTDTKGVDLELNGRTNLGEFGRVRTKFSATYVTSYRSSPAAGETMVEYAGSSNFPRMRAGLSMDWNKGPWGVSGSTNYVGAFSAVDSPEVEPCSWREQGYGDTFCRVASFTTVDLSLKYSGVKNLELGFQVQNAFDRKVPLYLGNTPGFSYIHNPMGRYYQASASYRFM